MSELKLVRHPETGELIPEIWKDVEGYEGYYQVSNYGRIRSTERKINYVSESRNGNKFESFFTKPETITKGTDNGKGYMFVSLTKNGERKNFYVHRLVAKAFVDNPQQKPQINHKNCDKSDNKALNLEWVTLKENMQHASENGLLRCSEYQKEQTSKSNRGSGHGNSKLTEPDIIKIRDMRKDGLTYKEIAQRFNVNRATIGYIIRGKTWSHV